MLGYVPYITTGFTDFCKPVNIQWKKVFKIGLRSVVQWDFNNVIWVHLSTSIMVKMLSPWLTLVASFLETTHIDCWIIKFGRILMHLNVTLWTLNMVCRTFKIYISSFSCTCSYETISHMNEAKAKSPSTWYSKHMPTISKLYPYWLQSYWTSKFGTIIPYAIFAHKRALPCVTKIILTQKLFGVASSNLG